jgi:hypothetical protein
LENRDGEKENREGETRIRQEGCRKKSEQIGIMPMLRWSAVVLSMLSEWSWFALDKVFVLGNYKK